MNCATWNRLLDKKHLPVGTFVFSSVWANINLRKFIVPIDVVEDGAHNGVIMDSDEYGNHLVVWTDMLEGALFVWDEFFLIG